MISSGHTPFQEFRVEPGATRSEAEADELVAAVAAGAVVAAAAVVAVGAAADEDALVGAAVAAAAGALVGAAGAVVACAGGVAVPPLQALRTPASSDEAKIPPLTLRNRRREVDDVAILLDFRPFSQQCWVIARRSAAHGATLVSS